MKLTAPQFEMLHFIHIFTSPVNGKPSKYRMLAKCFNRYQRRVNNNLIKKKLIWVRGRFVALTKLGVQSL